MQTTTTPRTMPTTTSMINLPPEVLERIALFLDPHSLTTSIRVSRLWFDCFLPSLYHTIHVYHFDYFSTDLGSGYPRRSDNIARTADTVGYGGRFLHKYGRFIKHVTVGASGALKYLLAPECVNLARVTTVYSGSKYPHNKFRAMPEGDEERKSWQTQGQFKGEYDDALVDQIWEPLFVQNPGLRRVSIASLPGLQKKMIRMTKALGGLSQLEELHIGFIRDWDVVEALLDHCPQVGKIAIETFVNKYSNPHQTFRSRDNYTQATNEPKTQIKELDLFSSGRINSQPWIIPVLWRCPLLERLIVPRYQGERHFGPLMRTIIEHCREMRYLKLLIQEEFTSPETVAALDDLLNTGCPRLTSLRLYDAADIFTLECHFWNQDLKGRLEEFRCNAPSKRLLRDEVPGAEVAFGVLVVCPKLRVFKAKTMMLEVEEFLEMELACLESLEVLHLRLRYRKLASSPGLVAGIEGEGQGKEEATRVVQDEDGDKEEGEGEGEGGEKVEEKEKKTQQKEQEEVRLYRQNTQDNVVDKLAQFTLLKKLRLGQDRSKDKDCGRFDVFRMDMSKGEDRRKKIKVFGERMPMLRRLWIDGVDHSKKVQAWRRR